MPNTVGVGISLSNEISSYKVLEFHMEDGYVPFYTVPIEALEEWGSGYEGCILVRDRDTWVSVKRITASGSGGTSRELILFEKDDPALLTIINAVEFMELNNVYYSTRNRN